MYNTMAAAGGRLRHDSSRYRPFLLEDKATRPRAAWTKPGSWKCCGCELGHMNGMQANDSEHVCTVVQGRQAAPPAGV
jgi:hypothetical protein